MDIKIGLVCFVLFLLCVDASVSNNAQEREARRRRRLRHGSHNQTQHDLDSGDFHSDDDNILDIPTYLHKITDKLNEISLVSNHQLRRLENLEYKITKLEVQLQEKTDGLRLETKEVSRRAQQLDWQSGKTEQALDNLRTDTAALKKILEQNFEEREVSGAGDAGLQVSDKIQIALRTVQTLQKDVSTLQTDVTSLKHDVADINNSTSALNSLLPALLTTRRFERGLFDLERRGLHSVCPVSHTNTKLIGQEDIPKDCSEIQGKDSGVYRIQPPKSANAFFVYCDFETANGGWTVIQHRPEGTLDFYRGWHDYKFGFGNIGKEHWLGLEKIHLLTNYKVNELYIELEDFGLKKTFAHYTSFSVGNEVEGYPISFLDGYNGTAGDSLNYHAGQKFSTHDVDHDNWPEGNCAQSHSGAWWYNGCDTSNLNGKYLSGVLPQQYEYQGMYWYEFQGPGYSLKSSKMMVRPRRDTSLGQINQNLEDTTEKY